jgi:hypothetical protein
MIHARNRGETFGIAVGEFALAGKPIFTWGDSRERAHLTELGSEAVIYWDEESLFKKMYNYQRGEYETIHAYHSFGPQNVMNKFKEVFL